MDKPFKNTYLLSRGAGSGVGLLEAAPSLFDEAKVKTAAVLGFDDIHALLPTEKTSYSFPKIG
ncbi:MAG: hypothetical protein JXB49_18350 [Bacteroidales bacterium]|nr:hypothetical protein [Bacteroidales bacterium]